MKHTQGQLIIAALKRKAHTYGDMLRIGEPVAWRVARDRKAA